MNRLHHLIIRNNTFPLFLAAFLCRLVWLPFLLHYTGLEFSLINVSFVVSMLIELVLSVFYKKIDRLVSITIFFIEVVAFYCIEGLTFKVNFGMDIRIYTCIPAMFLFTAQLKRPKYYNLFMDIMFVAALIYITWIKLDKLPPPQLFLPERRLYLIACEIFYTVLSVSILVYGCLITDATFRRLRRKSAWFLKELDYIAKHDPLTGLMNRRRTHQIFQELIEAKERDNTDYAIAIFDIDNFKKINDTWGHDAGDFILKTFTRGVWDFFPEPIRIGRWGGEEFVILFPEIDDNTIFRMEEIRLKLTKNPVIYNGNSISVTATCGICSSRQFNSPEAILSEADAMLLIGKQNGKNRIVVSPKF